MDRILRYESVALASPHEKSDVRAPFLPVLLRPLVLLLVVLAGAVPGARRGLAQPSPGGVAPGAAPTVVSQAPSAPQTGNAVGAADRGVAPSDRALEPPLDVPVERLSADADLDGVPDLMGRRLRLRGWASVGQDVLRRAPHQRAYLFDGRRGVRVFGHLPLALAKGDPLAVTGYLHDADGELSLRVDAMERLDGTAREIQPERRATLAGADTLVGRLVTLRGIVASHSTVSVGTAMGVLVGDSLVYAVRFFDAPRAYGFGAFVPGQQVEVTGVMGRYRRSWQLYPRSGADLRAVGLRPSHYRVLAFFAAGLLLLALAWAVHLVRLGRRRLAALTASQRRFQLLFSKAETGVVVARPTPDGLSILQANPAAMRLVGVGQPADGSSAVLSPADFVRNKDDMREHLALLASEGRDRRDFVLDRAGTPGDASTITIESYRVIENDTTLYFSFLHDITRQLAHERGLVDAREKAESFARMQSTFLRNMNHELRTPLAGIIGFAEVLRNDLDGEQQQFARYIEEGGRRLLGTLEDVLDLTRFASEKAVLDVRPFDLGALVHSLGGPFGARAEEHGQRLSVEAPRELTATLDRGAVQRVLEHLLSNALKFTPAGGSVALRLHEERGSDVHERRVVLTVEDTGIGMSETFQEHLYTLYTQESSGYARSHEGVGLGLYLVRALVSAMKGTLRVDSARGVGTTVTVELPRHLDVPAVPVQSAVPQPVSVS